MRYRINFSNYDRKKEIQKSLFGRAYWIVIIMLACLFVYGVIRFYGINLEIDKVRKEISEINIKLEKAKEERKRIISEGEEVVLRNKIKFYNEFKGAKLTQTAFLNIIEEKTPNNIKLISLDFDISRKSFIITGETLHPEAVVNYLSQLQSVEIFKKVTLTRQTMQKGTDKKLIIGNFEIKGELI
ncbi:MAG: hypothetical protein N2202_03295 [Proteobacteria bacterium]|nr:hypothetical protein [Pseudomonadota bacterium]